MGITQKRAMGMRRFWGLMGALWMALGMVHCTEDAPVVDGAAATDTSTVTGAGTGAAAVVEPVVAKHALSKLESCDGFVKYAKRAAIEKMAAQVAEIEFDEMCNGNGMEGGGGWLVDDMDVGMGVSDSATAAPRPVSQGVSNSGGDAPKSADSNGEAAGHGTFSTDTNVQEEGVDEADIIKNDGEYLYGLSNGELVLVEAGENGALTEMSRLTIGGAAKELFLYKDLVVVFSATSGDDVPESIRMQPPSWVDDEENGSKYYDPNYARSGYSRLTVVDVEDKSHPQVIREIDYAGEYVTSRRIKNSLRVVISSGIPSLNPAGSLEPYPFCSLPAGEEIYKTAVSALIKENIRLIQMADVDQIIPKKLDTRDGLAGEAQPIAACEQMYGPDTPAGVGILTVVTLNLDEPRVRQSDVATFGDEGIVYASQEALYLTSSKDYVDWAWRSGIWEEATSGIHKFDIASDPTKAIYKATGQVPGRMLNQFCLGEHNGYLRVATTTGTMDFSSWDNRLTIFEEQDGALVEVSYLDGFGKEEEIYGARFLGDRGFIVTFRQMDPLFTFDLSDPEDPQLVGMWEGPGYSSYLHPFGEDYLIAMGMEGGQVAMSLYDLTDFAEPALVKRNYLMMGDNGASMSSAAVNDHKAFLFVQQSDDSGLVTIPYSGWVDYMMANGGFETGIALFDVDTTGFTPAGNMAMIGPSVEGGERGMQEAVATRSLIIDNVLYGISNCRITSAALDAPETVLDSLALYSGDYCGNYYNGGEVDGWGGPVVRPALPPVETDSDGWASDGTSSGGIDGEVVSTDSNSSAGSDGVDTDSDNGEMGSSGSTGVVEPALPVPPAQPVDAGV